MVRRVMAQNAVRDAIELTEDFVKYYYHAAPFRREALGAAWDRCRGQGCATERAEAQQRLGPLSTLPPSR